MIKNLPASAGDIKDIGRIPGLGRSPGEEHSDPLQYSCLENPMDRRDWQAAVHRVAKSRTRLKRLSMHTHIGSAVLTLDHQGSPGLAILKLEGNLPGRKVRERGNGRKKLPFCIQAWGKCFTDI